MKGRARIGWHVGASANQEARDAKDSFQPIMLFVMVFMLHMCHTLLCLARSSDRQFHVRVVRLLGGGFTPNMRPFVRVGNSVKTSCGCMTNVAKSNMDRAVAFQGG